MMERLCGMGREHDSNKYREFDGWLFSYEITNSRFLLKLLRLIPIASFRLDDVRYIRQRSGEGMWGLWGEFRDHPFRCWYWPHPVMSRSPKDSSPYVIQLLSGRKVFVRLRAGFHYSLRAAIGTARAKKQEAWLIV